MVKATKRYGLHVQPAALQAMLRYSRELDNLDHLNPILEQLQEQLARVSPKIITPQLWEEAVQEVKAVSVALSGKAVATAVTTKPSIAATSTLGKKAGTASKTSLNRTLSSKSKHPDWHLLDAFETPTLVYDSLRQQFHYENRGSKRPSLMGTAEDKVEMMSQRFLRVQQRVTRSVAQLTSIDRLLGSRTTLSQYLLGLLHATSTSSAMAQAEGIAATGFELEDLTGKIPLQLHSGTIIDSKGLYTEGCIVMVTGYYDDGIFVVDALKLPPIESKTKSQPYLPPLPADMPALSQAAMLTPLTLYTMANVALDEPAVLQQLEDLVNHLASDDMERKQVILVLMGNFATSSISLSLALEELSRVLEPLPSNHSVIVMPGPNDTPSMCWPIPPIKAPSSFSNHLKARVEFGSNPCRLQYGSQQDILLCRQDMIRQHLQHEILSTRDANSSSSPLAGQRRERPQAIGNRILHTVLAQGHLLPQAPIYWNYDYALTAYPLPDLMLLGLEEGEEKVRSFQEADCQVLAPGSNGNWAKVTLQPRSKRRGSRRPLEFEFSQQENEDSDMGGEISDVESMDAD